MTTLIEAARQALEALESAPFPIRPYIVKMEEAITALRQAIEQAQKQEPVALYVYKPTLPRLNLGNVSDGDLPWVYDQDPSSGYSARMLVYTSPPPRQPLTDEQKDAARWRFLVDNSYDKEGLAQFHVWHHTWEPHSQTSEPTEWKARVRGPALERVIDEAIEAAHGIKGEA